MNTYNAETLEEALTLASDELNCSTENVNYYKNEVETGVSITAWTMDDIKEFLFDYLGNFFMGFDCDLECAIEEKDGGFIVNLNAENNGALIGKMGKTIASLNTVVCGAVNATFKKRIDILIDVNRYKEDRYHRVRSLARHIAKQVQKSHVDVALDPMPNDERKAIHKALNNWHNIKTESEGTGVGRHVCIKYVPNENEKEIPEETSIEEKEIVEIKEELVETIEAK